MTSGTRVVSDERVNIAKACQYSPDDTNGWILIAIKAWKDACRKWPTMQDLRPLLGFAPTSPRFRERLVALKAKGYIHFKGAAPEYNPIKLLRFPYVPESLAGLVALAESLKEGEDVGES